MESQNQGTIFTEHTLQIIGKHILGPHARILQHLSHFTSTHLYKQEAYSWPTGWGHTAPFEIQQHRCSDAH